MYRCTGTGSTHTHGDVESLPWEGGGGAAPGTAPTASGWCRRRRSL